MERNICKVWFLELIDSKRLHSFFDQHNNLLECFSVTKNQPGAASTQGELSFRNLNGICDAKPYILRHCHHLLFRKLTVILIQIGSICENRNRLERIKYRRKYDVHHSIYGVGRRVSVTMTKKEQRVRLHLSKTVMSSFSSPNI
jgi:hypothetical protein